MKIIKTDLQDGSTEGSHGYVIKMRLPRGTKGNCNLCGGEFNMHSKFDRFCALCKVDSELYHFAEWLSA